MAYCMNILYLDKNFTLLKGKEYYKTMLFLLAVLYKTFGYYFMFAHEVQKM